MDKRLEHLRSLPHSERTLLILSVITIMLKLGREQLFQMIREMMPEATAGEMLRELLLTMTSTMSQQSGPDVPMFCHFALLIENALHESIPNVPFHHPELAEQELRCLIAELHGEDGQKPSSN